MRLKPRACKNQKICLSLKKLANTTELNYISYLLPIYSFRVLRKFQHFKWPTLFFAIRSEERQNAGNRHNPELNRRLGPLASLDLFRYIPRQIPSRMASIEHRLRRTARPIHLCRQQHG